jgi:hypothetical protein
MPHTAPDPDGVAAPERRPPAAAGPTPDPAAEPPAAAGSAPSASSAPAPGTDHLAAPGPAAPSAGLTGDPVHLVRRAWQSVLDVEAVPLDTGFFDAGGNSMLLVMLADELADLTGRELDVAELFRHDTVVAQARLLDPDYATEQRPAPPAATGRGRLLGAGRAGRGGTSAAAVRPDAQPKGSAAR